VDAIVIREAQSRERPAIRSVVRHAFGQANEANLVEQLRTDGDVLLELVFAEQSAIQGHILYSKLSIDRGGETLAAAALAPVSILPAFQRRGLGVALIEAGNARCAALGLKAILVLGHAEYYPRFGFSSRAAESLNAPFSGPAFMALEVEPDCLKAGGRVRYAAAFGV
jgi:putative acetyltransferase